MRKPFDLNYYLEHPEIKVVTREGNNVRIICTDAKVENPVIALVTITEIEEEVVCYYCDGGFREDVEDNFDLFFDLPDPEKKGVPLTYEDLLQRVNDGKTMWITNKATDVSKAYTRYISNFDCNGVFYVFEFEIMFLSYEKLIENQNYFADGTPCWKEVDCE